MRIDVAIAVPASQLQQTLYEASLGPGPGATTNVKLKRVYRVIPIRLATCILKKRTSLTCNQLKKRVIVTKALIIGSKYTLFSGTPSCGRIELLRSKTYYRHTSVQAWQFFLGISRSQDIFIILQGSFKLTLLWATAGSNLP